MNLRTGTRTMHSVAVDCRQITVAESARLMHNWTEKAIASKANPETVAKQKVIGCRLRRKMKSRKRLREPP